LTFRSTFSQIVWLQVLAVAATSLIMPVAIFLFLDRTVTAYQVQMLGQREQALFQALRPAPGGGVAVPERLSEAYGHGISGFAFTVMDASGRVLASSEGDRGAAGSVPRSRAVGVFRRRTPRGSYFGASFPETLAGRPVWIQLEQNLQNPDVVLDDVMARFLPQVAWLSGGLLLFLLVSDIVIVRRALAPILKASAMAEAISPSRIEVRLPAARLPREILPLVEAVNQALDRLEEGFRVQRDLTADVAHELRTPLAVLRMRTEAVAEPLLRTRLLADIDVMTRLVSQLLAIAELETIVVTDDDRADLRAVCVDVIDLLAPLAVGQGRQIELVSPSAPVWVRGKADLLFQAVKNLVENAVAHSRKAGTVTVEVDVDGRVRVLDRGPGVPAELRGRLFERFWRGRRKDRSPIGAGAGLGLSIVARIAEQHGGGVSVADRPGGGAVFVLALQPVAAGPAGAA
jgi:signal transduction histidine kinase